MCSRQLIPLRHVQVVNVYLNRCNVFMGTWHYALVPSFFLYIMTFLRGVMVHRYPQRTLAVSDVAFSVSVSHDIGYRCEWVSRTQKEFDDAIQDEGSNRSSCMSQPTCTPLSTLVVHLLMYRDGVVFASHNASVPFTCLQVCLTNSSRLPLTPTSR